MFVDTPRTAALTLLVGLAATFASCGQDTAGGAWQYDELWFDVETLPNGEWTPSSSQPFAEFLNSENWLGSVRDQVYYARETSFRRRRVITGSGDGTWHELEALNDRLADATEKWRAIYGVGDELYLDGKHDETLHHPGGDADWRDASVTIVTAASTGDRLYAALDEPESLRGLAVKTPDSDWRRLRENVREFWVAGDVVHANGYFSTDGGDTWTEHDNDTRVNLREPPRVLADTGDRFWTVAGSNPVLKSSPNGLDWTEVDPQPAGHVEDVAAHGDRVFVLTTENESRTIFRLTDGAWQRVALPEHVSPRELEATDDALFVPARAGGVWRYDASSQSMIPQNLPAGSPRLTVGTDVIVATPGGNSESFAIRERGEEAGKWRYHRRDEEDMNRIRGLGLAGRAMVYEEFRGGSPSLRISRPDASGELTPWMETDRFERVFAIVPRGDRYWIGSLENGVHVLDAQRTVDSSVEPLTFDDWNRSRSVGLVRAGDAVWAAASADDVVDVHRQLEGSSWKRTLAGLPDRFEREISEGERMIQLVAIDGAPILAVSESSSDESKTYFFGWHEHQGRWLETMPAFDWSGSDSRPTVRTTGNVLLLAAKSGVFQFDPEVGRWSELGALDNVVLPSRLAVDDSQLWLTRKGRGIWRFRPH